MSYRQRTGVLTFHRCINYGSYWQARCLVEGLRARGHDAVLLDHHSWKVNLAEWKCALQPTLPTPAPPRDRRRYGLKMLQFFRAFASLPQTPPFDLERPEAAGSFDLLVVGSDEVWNHHHPWYGRCGLFYGVGLQATRLASYAASFGSHHVSEGLEQPWVDHLRAFDRISVRDQNSLELVRNALGLEPELVLDPCLQFLPQPEGRWRGPREPFAAVYGHNFSEAFAAQVRRWARSRGVPLVSIGYRNDWADRQWITAGPHDFAHAISRARAVATNFFHGCVFALRGGKPFACEMSAYRSIKVENLMRTVGGERHLVWWNAPAEAYDACLDEPVQPEVLHRIQRLRETSETFLRSLEGVPQRAPVSLEPVPA